MGGPVDIPGNRLRAIVERIEQVEDEIKDMTEAKKEIYAKAKSNGFDVKVLREVIRVRKQDQKERERARNSPRPLYVSDKGSVLGGESCVTKSAGGSGEWSSLMRLRCCCKSTFEFR